MAKFVLNGVKYNTRKLKKINSTCYYSLYMTDDGKFIEESMFYFIHEGNARIVNEEHAKWSLTRERQWTMFEKKWGYVPEN